VHVKIETRLKCYFSFSYFFSFQKVKNVQLSHAAHPRTSRDDLITAE
jgi:hypothetical protein